MKKGFMLIELLVSILILGIITLIAIPTANNIVSAIDDACQLQMLKGKTITILYTIVTAPTNIVTIVYGNQAKKYDIQNTRFLNFFCS